MGAVGEGCSEESEQHLQKHCGSSALGFRGRPQCRCQERRGRRFPTWDGPVSRWVCEGIGVAPRASHPPSHWGPQKQPVRGPPAHRRFFPPEFLSDDISPPHLSQGGRRPWIVSEGRLRSCDPS